jgi:peroxiredoxin Q/BCP
MCAMAKELALALREGDKAPDFTAKVSDGSIISLADFKGRHVVLYFYPRDDTPGCTKEACGFRDVYEKFKARGAAVIGVSTDSMAAHTKFATKYKLPFLLAADEEKQIVQAYGVWGQKTFLGRKYMGTHRVTFLIGPDRRIKKIWPKVKPEQHPREVLAAISDGD